MTRNRVGALATLLVWLLAGRAPLRAQDNALTLELERPDNKTETIRGRRVDDPQKPPAIENVTDCGNLSISLRQISYDRSRQVFHYYLLIKPDTASQWQEWLVNRNDEGRFSPRLNPVTVYFQTAAHGDDKAPSCSNFRLPMYCLAECSQNTWWEPSKDSPQSLTIYFGATNYWDYVLKKQIPFPVKLSDESLTIGNEDLWHKKLDRGRAEGELRLSVEPKFSQWRACRLPLKSPTTSPRA